MPRRSDRFVFTVTDLAVFLGKSAVTIRGWERQALINLPRDSGGDRKLNVSDIRSVSKWAREAGRITLTRYRWIEATCTLLTLLEGD